MDEILQNLIGQHKDGFVSKLTDSVGFDAGTAQNFVSTSLQKVVGLFTGDGGFDLSQLTGGLDAQDIMSKLNIGELAKETGVDEAKAEAGLSAMLPDVLGKAKEMMGSGGDILGQLGDLGDLGKKLF